MKIDIETANFVAVATKALFKEWLDVKAENKHTCQECHMPPVKRRITQSEKFISKMIVATEDESVQKKHTFGIYMELPDIAPFHVTVNREGELLNWFWKITSPMHCRRGILGFGL